MLHVPASWKVNSPCKLCRMVWVSIYSEALFKVGPGKHSAALYSCPQHVWTATPTA